MTPERLTFHGHEGLRLAADAVGDPAAAPVLLLHGGGQTRHAWGATAQSLAELGYRAICLDARGHGESDWDPRGRYDLEWFARDLCAVRAALGERPSVIGASLGGSTALTAVGALGLDVAALVLVDIAPRLEPGGVKRIVDFMRASPAGFASLEEAADMVASYLPHRERPQDLSGLSKNLRRGEDGRFRWHWDPRFLEAIQRIEPSIRDEEREAAARNIVAPTLLVRGMLSDLLSEDGARHFLTLVPHADYVNVAGAGHMVAGDSNERFGDAVGSFLQRHVATGRGQSTTESDRDCAHGQRS
ncbi:MAG: alpha/beta hydrolase [Myxococcales bacterium]|nr:alpha/beta hydrolase [Myxococcales bacterium]